MKEKTKAQKTRIKEKTKEKKYYNVDINFTVIAIIFLIFIGIWLTPIAFQNDTFYTIKIGELIKNNGIDMMDHFSYHGIPYTYPHWLYDLCTYLVYSIGGFAGIYCLTAVLSVILSVSIFKINSKLTKNEVISFIVTLGVLYMLKGYITARAQLATFILFIWEIYFIEKFLENKKIGYAVGLVIISLLIANLHVATWPFFFVLFLPYIGEYIISILADTIIYKKVKIFVLNNRIKSLKKKNPDSEKLKELEKKLEDIKHQVSKIKIKREEKNKEPYKLIIKRNPNVKWLIIIMIVCILMGFLTPIGDTPFTYLYKTMQGNTTSNISEHLPLIISKSTDIMIMYVIFLAILIFTRVKLRLADFFMISGLCFLMLSTRRQTSMFVLICSIILTRMIIDLINRYTQNGLEKFTEAFKHFGVIIALSAFMMIIAYNVLQNRTGEKFVSEKSYPVKACDYVIENIDYKNDKTRFYNEYNYGSYMLYRGIPVFIDSRADLYTPEFNGDKDKNVFTDFIEINGLGKMFEETFEKYKITHLLINSKSKIKMVIDNYKDKKYKEIYKDDNFSIYERKGD